MSESIELRGLEDYKLLPRPCLVLLLWSRKVLFFPRRDELELCAISTEAPNGCSTQLEFVALQSRCVQRFDMVYLIRSRCNTWIMPLGGKSRSWHIERLKLHSTSSVTVVHLFHQTCQETSMAGNDFACGAMQARQSFDVHSVSRRPMGQYRNTDRWIGTQQDPVSRLYGTCALSRSNCARRGFAKG